MILRHQIIIKEDGIGNCSDNVLREWVLGNEIRYNDLLKARGYIYLNEVYQYFGVAWNADYDNECFRLNEQYEGNKQIELTYFKTGESEILLIFEYRV